jgi:hypothetical protein
MDLNQRGIVRALLLAACASLALGFLAVAPAAAAIYVDGYVSTGPSADCVMVRDHEGRVYALEGTGWHGIVGNEYVRLEGRVVPDRRCGVRNGFEVADVSGIWNDDAHRVSTYVRDRDGRFHDWAQRHRQREWSRWEEHRDRHERHEGEEHHEPPPPNQ